MNTLWYSILSVSMLAAAAWEPLRDPIIDQFGGVAFILLVVGFVFFAGAAYASILLRRSPLEDRK